MLRDLDTHRQRGRGEKVLGKEDYLTGMPLVKKATPFSEYAWRYWQCLHMNQCERFVILKFKERFFLMRRNILYLREERVILSMRWPQQWHAAASTGTAAGRHSKLLKGGDRACFASMVQEHLGQDLTHSEPFANISWMKNKSQHLLGVYYLRHLLWGLFFFY